MTASPGEGRVGVGGVGEIEATVMVIAKAPLPGRAKTRLSPPLSPHSAADVAAACLLDTIDAVTAAPVARRVLVFDGDPGPWCPPGWDVVPQRGGPLGQRLANAFSDVPGPALVVAMDTPQLDSAMLRHALAQITAGEATAALGRTDDGGYWALGLPASRVPAEVFDGVPMSTAHTGAAQRRRLVELGFQVVDLPWLRDIDAYDDLLAVAELVPDRRVGAYAPLNRRRAATRRS